MRLSKANISGLASPLQQAEMKSILAGTWPPLKPLPVFKYETVEYRASIDFDKKRGEWVCRKTSLPSNQVQELRGGLREITMALPHGESEPFTDDMAQQEQELERDTNRRLQAIRDWREQYENGAIYSELRNYLSESQRTEIDDSLRLSLTARQLQFNSKNIAYVFDALSTAGGRFAAIIELAKLNEAKQQAVPQAQEVAGLPEAERAIEHDEQFSESSSGESRCVVNSPSVSEHEAPEGYRDADHFPALSIKNIVPDQDHTPSAERVAYSACRQSGVESFEVVDGESASLTEQLHLEGLLSPLSDQRTAQGRTNKSLMNDLERSPSRFSTLEISAFHVAVIASLSLLGALLVGLTVGRGPLGRHLPEATRSLLATKAEAPILHHQADQSTSRTPNPSAAGSKDSTTPNRLDDMPREEKSKESNQGAEYSAAPRDTDSSPAGESTPSPKVEVGTMRSASPPASSAPAHLADATGPTGAESSGPYRLTPRIGATVRARPPVILVTVPGPGSRSFKAIFPEKAIGATTALAMSSQLSVLVSPERESAVAHNPARVEAGELVSFVWPHYPKPRERNGLAEIITVRATIGQLGQVLDVRYVKGSNALLPGTMRAVRQWRFRPTLLDKRPVQAQEDVTIEFRPAEYSSRLSNPHAFHK